jgi:hypothetical protein
VKSYRGGSERDQANQVSSDVGVPGRRTLVEQLPVVQPAQRAPAPAGADRFEPPLRMTVEPPQSKAVVAAAIGEPASTTCSSLPRLDLGSPRSKAVGSPAAGVDIGGPSENKLEGSAAQGSEVAAQGNGVPAVEPPAEKKKKKAGVESFTVDWARGQTAGPTAANLRLDYNAKFKKDDEHDPALAEFRQNAMTVWEITDGPRKGAKGNTSPLHDDNYSRADDVAGHKITDQVFQSNDNPGWSAGQLDKDDVLEYAFTAEQMIIDTSDGNKVIAKRGPHTATIKGKDPRAYGNVPKKLG